MRGRAGAVSFGRTVFAPLCLLGALAVPLTLSAPHHPRTGTLHCPQHVPRDVPLPGLCSGATRLSRVEKPEPHRAGGRWGPDLSQHDMGALVLCTGNILRSLCRTLKSLLEAAPQTAFLSLLSPGLQTPASLSADTPQAHSYQPVNTVFLCLC